MFLQERNGWEEREKRGGGRSVAVWCSDIWLAGSLIYKYLLFVSEELARVG